MRHELLKQAARRVSPYRAGLAPPSAAPPQVQAVVSPLREGRVGIGAQIAELAPLIQLVGQLSELMEREQLSPLRRKQIEADIDAQRAAQRANDVQARLLDIQANMAQLQLDLERDPKNREIKNEIARLQRDKANLEKQLTQLRIESEKKKLDRRTKEDIEADWYAKNPEAVTRRLDDRLASAESSYQQYKQALATTIQTTTAFSPQTAYQLSFYVFDALPELSRARDPRATRLATHYYGILQSALRTAQDKGDDNMVQALNQIRADLEKYLPGAMAPDESEPQTQTRLEGIRFVGP